MRRKFERMLMVAMLAGSATPSFAATTINFTLSGTHNATFSFASDKPFTNATISGYSSDTFRDVAGVFSGIPGVADFSIFDAASGGGFQLTFPTSYIGPLGPVIYQGTLANPTFAPGTFRFTQAFGVGAVDDTLVISIGAVQAPVPEPSTWGLMLTGMFGLGVAMRRARSHTRVRFRRQISVQSHAIAWSPGRQCAPSARGFSCCRDRAFSPIRHERRRGGHATRRRPAARPIDAGSGDLQEG